MFPDGLLLFDLLVVSLVLSLSLNVAALCLWLNCICGKRARADGANDSTNSVNSRGNLTPVSVTAPTSSGSNGCELSGINNLKKKTAETADKDIDRCIFVLQQGSVYHSSLACQHLRKKQAAAVLQFRECAHCVMASYKENKEH